MGVRFRNGGQIPINWGNGGNGVRFQLIHAACRPRWARPPLTAAELRRSLRARPTMFCKLKHHFKAARPGGHFLSERPEKCAPMAGGAGVPSEPAWLDEAQGSHAACIPRRARLPLTATCNPTICKPANGLPVLNSSQTPERGQLNGDIVHVETSIGICDFCRRRAFCDIQSRRQCGHER